MTQRRPGLWFGGLYLSSLAAFALLVFAVRLILWLIR